jgi:hypothetical protein
MIDIYQPRENVLPTRCVPKERLLGCSFHPKSKLEKTDFADVMTSNFLRDLLFSQNQ